MHSKGRTTCLLTKTVLALHTQNVRQNAQHLVMKISSPHHASQTEPTVRQNFCCSARHKKQTLPNLLNPSLPFMQLMRECSAVKMVTTHRNGTVPGFHSCCTCRLAPVMLSPCRGGVCHDVMSLTDFYRNSALRCLSSSTKSSDSDTGTRTNKDREQTSQLSKQTQEQKRLSGFEGKSSSPQEQSSPSQASHASKNSLSQKKTVSFQESSSESQGKTSHLRQKLTSKEPEIMPCDESCPGPEEQKRLPRGKGSPSQEQKSVSQKSCAFEEQERSQESALALQKHSDMKSQVQKSEMSLEPSSLEFLKQRDVMSEEQKHMVSQEPSSVISQAQKSEGSQGQSSLVSQEQSSLVAQEAGSLVQQDGGGDVELPITVWGVRLANENCYLAWCRNTYLMSIMGIILMGPGNTFLIKSVGAGLMILSGINLTWGTYCYIFNLIFLRIQVGMTRIAVLAQVILASVHLVLCLFFGCLYLDDIPGKPAIGGGKKESAPSTPSAGVGGIDNLPEGWDLGPGSEERRTMIRDRHIISGKKKLPPKDGQ